LDHVADARAGSNPEHDLMSRELGNRIGHALGKLSPRERMVFELKHYHGLKLRTVGEILHTTEETAKNTLFRATQKLRGALAAMRSLLAELRATILEVPRMGGSQLIAQSS